MNSFSVAAIRKRVNVLRDDFPLGPADALSQLSPGPAESPNSSFNSSFSSSILDNISSFSATDIIDLFFNIFPKVSFDSVSTALEERKFEKEQYVLLLNLLFSKLISLSRAHPEQTSSFCDSVFDTFFAENRFFGFSNYVSLCLSAAQNLKSAGRKPEILINFLRCIAETRGAEDYLPGQSLMPLNRMPFALIEHQIAVYTCRNVNQVQSKAFEKVFVNSFFFFFFSTNFELFGFY